MSDYNYEDDIYDNPTGTDDIMPNYNPYPEGGTGEDEYDGGSIENEYDDSEYNEGYDMLDEDDDEEDEGDEDEDDDSDEGNEDDDEDEGGEGKEQQEGDGQQAEGNADGGKGKDKDDGKPLGVKDLSNMWPKAKDNPVTAPQCKIINEAIKKPLTIPTCGIIMLVKDPTGLALKILPYLPISGIIDKVLLAPPIQTALKEIKKALDKKAPKG